MKILEWNINAAIGSRYGRNDLCSLFSQRPTYDIIVLTEFFRLHDFEEFDKKFQDWGYITFITERYNNRNDVFIAVYKDYEPQLIENKKERISLPDMLIVSIIYEQTKFFLVGIRFFGNYSDMKNQFSEIISSIKEFDKLVIAGDFNNGKIHGKENIILDEEGINNIYDKYAHNVYNYHRLKLWLYKKKISLITPEKGVSYPYKSPYKGGSKIDHFAIRNICIKEVFYLKSNQSDHNQLIGSIEL